MRNAFRQIRKLIGIYRMYAASAIKTVLTHRAAFAAGAVGQILSYGSSYVSIYLLISNFSGILKWSSEQVLFFYGFNLLSYSIAATFVFQPSVSLGRRLLNGEFDSTMIKPYEPLTYEILTGFSPGYLGHYLLSMTLIVFAIVKMRMNIGILSILSFIIMLISATVAQGCMLLLGAAASFWIAGRKGVTSVFFNLLREATSYPVNIYPIIVQFVLTFVIPAAFLNFYPSVAVLGADELSLFSDFLPYLSPLVSFLLLKTTIIVWKHGFRQYQSSGS